MTRASASTSRLPPPPDHGHAAADHGGEGQLADQRRTGIVRPQAGVQGPGRDQRARRVRAQRALGPAAEILQRAGGEGGHAVQPALAPFAVQQLEQIPAVGILAQQAEGQRGVLAEHARGHVLQGLAVAGRERVQAPGGVGHVLPERQAPAVRPDQAGRIVAAQHFQPGLLQLGLEFGIARTADEQRMPGREHLVPVAGEQFLGADAAAEPVVAFQHQHALAAHGQQRRADQRIDAAADEHHLGFGRRAHACSTSASTRKGLPEPPSIFSGAAGIMAPCGGS